MAPTDLQPNLSNLTTDEAVADGLYRALVGLDSNDRALFDSAFHDSPNTAFIMNSSATTGLGALHGMADKIGPLITSHMTSNVRVQVDASRSKAKLTCNAINQHFSAGSGNLPGRKDFVAEGNPNKHFLAGGQYFVDLVKDERNGLWKVTKWVFEISWTQGNVSVLA